MAASHGVLLPSIGRAFQNLPFKSEATDLGDNYSFSNDRLALVIAPLDRSQEKDYEGADNVIIR
ncbi:hypothetical protein WN944_013911 [Citrus x changshan-huyou]|uniref:Uncharacterized protein n=1 Tax=Citrus x changshan-huyou TaxID=2935761 RepID=A0AAP0QL83_9ROSI